MCCVLSEIRKIIDFNSRYYGGKRKHTQTHKHTYVCTLYAEHAHNICRPNTRSIRQFACLYRFRYLFSSLLCIRCTEPNAEQYIRRYIHACTHTRAQSYDRLYM